MRPAFFHSFFHFHIAPIFYTTVLAALTRLGAVQVVRIEFDPEAFAHPLHGIIDEFLWAVRTLASYVGGAGEAARALAGIPVAARAACCGCSITMCVSEYEYVMVDVVDNELVVATMYERAYFANSCNPAVEYDGAIDAVYEVDSETAKKLKKILNELEGLDERERKRLARMAERIYGAARTGYTPPEHC